MPSIDISNSELAKWRRKLKGWIKSTEKPENSNLKDNLFSSYSRRISFGLS